jgi:5-methylcytosine-specific restriction protein A
MPWMPEDRKRKQMHERRVVEPRYNTTRWRRYRAHYLAINPLCVQCSRAATVVDHVQPVRLGGEFWEPSNHQGLCAACHNSKSGREAHKPHTYSK